MESGRYAGKTNSGFLSKYEFNLSLFGQIVVFVVLLGLIIFGAISLGTDKIPSNNSSVNGDSLKLHPIECRDYQSEIERCENAVKLVSENYEGEVFSVTRNQTFSRNQTINFWIIGMRFEPPTTLKDGVNASLIRFRVSDYGDLGIYELVK
ncbi:MAG: hypothetical protein HYT71_02200 [Candidatus Aenigmarchaeota archaeon]|nr:hypothetical protein [Candidatus Aenigmarchaeota archaeon]